MSRGPVTDEPISASSALALLYRPNIKEKNFIFEDQWQLSNMNKTLPVNEALKPLSWLIGRWVGVNGVGEYPTINSFKYCEEVEFVSLGQPLLNFTSHTWHAEKKNPMHCESGFLRIKPGTKEVAFTVSHNFGVSEVEEGEVEDNKLVLESKNIIRTSFAKDPAVTKVRREYILDGDLLTQTLSMATTKTPLTKHLSITYNRKPC